MLRLSLLLMGSLAVIGLNQPIPAGEFPAVSELRAHESLPDPLVLMNGEKVTSKADWENKRRPELKALFQHYMYGFLPPAPEKIRTKLTLEDREYFGGTAIKRQVDLHFGPKGTPPIHLLLVIPKSDKPVPAFFGMNFCGNHTLLNDATIALPTSWMRNSCPGCANNKASDEGRGKKIANWSIEQSVKHGYAVATFYSGDIDPDKHDFSDGVHPHYLKPNQKSPGPHDWGTIAAWAFGLHRVVDYLITVPEVDNDRLAVMGHSRNGKTALLAGALDERIALAIPHQAGCGGTSPSRGTVGESVERINTSFPHWFNDTFPKFNKQVHLLPFDQHCLVALMAPRPVLLSNATQDTWANPAGQFEMLVAADPVYKLLGVQGLKQNTMPEVGMLVDSNLGYYIRPGKHSTTKEDWQIFLKFADAHFRSDRKP